jgi:hypothetical protein
MSTGHASQMTLRAMERLFVNNDGTATEEFGIGSQNVLEFRGSREL